MRHRRAGADADDAAVFDIGDCLLRGETFFCFAVHMRVSPGSLLRIFAGTETLDVISTGIGHARYS
jgi:hypothetical protein